MAVKVIDGAVVTADRKDYGDFKRGLYSAVRERPDIKENLFSRYETLLVKTADSHSMCEDGYGAVLSILLEGNRSVIPAYNDLSTLPRRFGWKNGKKELLKPPVSDETRKKNPDVSYDAAFDPSLNYFARGIFRAAGRLEIIIEKPEKKESCNESLLTEERDYSVADLAEQQAHGAADYLAVGKKYLAAAMKSVANAGTYAASAVANRYRHRNNAKNMAREEIDERSSQKLDDACQNFEKKISSLRSVSERGKIVSIYNQVTGETVMAEKLWRHHEMRWTSIIPELLHSTVKYHIERSAGLKQILEEKVAAMVNLAVKAKKRAI